MNEFNSYNYTDKSSNDISKIYNDYAIKKDIIHLYNILDAETNLKSNSSYNQHIVNLYNEWLIEFKNSDTGRYNKAELNHFLDDHYLIDLKKTEVYKFIFAINTYFCMINKLLVAKTLKQVDNGISINKITWSELSSLFLNSDPYFSAFTDGLFDVDYYSWFVSVGIRHTYLVNQISETILNRLQLYDISNTLCYSKKLGEQLINLYSLLAPFDEIGFCETYSGQDFLSLLDHKITSYSSKNKLEFSLAKKISLDLIGFASNKISLLITKSSYILTIFYKMSNFKLNEPLMFKIFPVVSKSFQKFDFNNESGLLKVTLETYVGNFIIPLSEYFYTDILFFDEISKFLEDKRGFSAFWAQICKKINNISSEKKVISNLYEELMLLRTPIQYDFWSIYIKNKITPLLIKS